jgi:hypothetical protein
MGANIRGQCKESGSPGVRAPLFLLPVQILPDHVQVNNEQSRTEVNLDVLLPPTGDESQRELFDFNHPATNRFPMLFVTLIATARCLKLAYSRATFWCMDTHYRHYE